MNPAGSLNPAAMAPPPARVPALASARPAGQPFAHALSGAMEASARAATLRGAAEQLVSSALITPLFQALQEPSFGLEGPLAPGLGERRFAPLLHQHLADRMTNASQLPLVDTVVGRFQSIIAAAAGGEAKESSA